MSAGAKNTVVPNVIGKKLEEAIVLIERNNLEVGTVEQAAKNGYGKGLIFKQSKKAYETVPEKTVINLYVSTGEEEPGAEGNPESSENGDATEKKPENNTETEKAPQSTKKKKVHLTLGNLPKDREKVNIRLVLDGQTYYEKDFQTAPGTASVTVETEKTLSLDVYYDGVYITTKEVKI